MGLSQRAPSPESRTSVRGAFGPKGMLGDKRRRSSDGVMNRAQLFQLDRCLDAKEFDKIIYQFGSAADARSQQMELSKNKEPLEYNAQGFVRYLVQIQALSTLLFWKDAEEFTTLFGGQERAEAAKKIFSRYLKPGAEFEVGSMQGAQVDAIKKELSSPGEDLFDQLQQQAYASMLFELFPRFWEEVKSQDRAGKKERSKLTQQTTLKDIISANDLEVHLFAEYCREHLCEDCVIFLLEVQMFTLLFDPADLRTQARRVFQAYLDEKSEGRIVASATEMRRVEALLAAVESGELGTPVSVTGITPQLYDKLADEVRGTLNMDVWPRYKEFVLSGSTDSVSLAGIDATSFVDMNVPSKKAVAAALRNPQLLEHLRSAAASQGVKESVDFCVACETYKLLFSDDDRRPRAKLIHETYLMAGCDTPVNLPHTMIQKVEANLSKCEPELFEACLQETLQVISDNIYTLYLKDVEKQKEADAAKAKANAAKTASASGGGGGCCLLM